MHLSHYLQVREVDGGRYVGLYNPFGHEFAFIRPDEWRASSTGQFSELNSAVYDDLVRRRFLVEDGFEDIILREYLPPSEHIREMWLVVEQACNMTCQYCVTEGNVETPERRTISDSRKHIPIVNGNKTTDTMPIAVAKAAVEKFAAYLQSSRPPFPRVTLYGGEPLLNWPVLETVIPIIRSISFPGQLRDKPVQALVITNGQVFSKDILDFFVEHQVAVSVSLDGTREHHDAARKMPSGAGTFNRAAKTLRAYQQAGLQVGICTTVGKHNVTDLPAIADYFAQEFGCPVELQVPFQIPFNGGNTYTVRMVDAAPYALEAFERLRAKNVLEGLAARRLFQVQRGVFHHRDCSAVGGQWVVAPDGSMGPCHALAGERTFFVGNVLDSTNEPWYNPAFHEWSRRQPVNMLDCHGCSAIAICGGGCPYNAYVHSGSIWNKDPQQCDYMHYLVDWLIDDVWKHLNDAPQSTEGKR